MKTFYHISIEQKEKYHKEITQLKLTIAPDEKEVHFVIFTKEGIEEYEYEFSGERFNYLSILDSWVGGHSMGYGYIELDNNQILYATRDWVTDWWHEEK